MALDHVIQAKAKGVDLVLITLQTRYPGLTLIVDSKLKDKVKTVKDLKGLRLGVTSLGAGTHLALNALLAKNGMKPEDVQILPVGSSTMPAAMEGGRTPAP